MRVEVPQRLWHFGEMSAIKSFMRNKGLDTDSAKWIGTGRGLQGEQFQIFEGPELECFKVED